MSISEKMKGIMVSCLALSVLCPSQGQFNIQEVVQTTLEKNGVRCSSDDIGGLTGCILKIISVGITNIVQNCTLNCTSVYNLHRCANDADFSAPCVETLPKLFDNLLTVIPEALQSLAGGLLQFADLSCMNETKVLAVCPDYEALIHPVWTEWQETSCDNNVRSYSRSCVNKDDVSMARKGCQGSGAKTDTKTCSEGRNAGGSYSKHTCHMIIAVVLVYLIQTMLIE